MRFCILCRNSRWPPKWQQSDFCEMLPVHSESADTLRVKNFIKIALSRTVSKINVFYAEIQDGRQKWWESDFCIKSPVDSAAQITCRSEILWKSLIGRNDFYKKCHPYTLQIPCGSNVFCRNGSISHHFRNKCACALYTEIQDVCQKWREREKYQ